MHIVEALPHRQTCEISWDPFNTLSSNVARIQICQPSISTAWSRGPWSLHFIYFISPNTNRVRTEQRRATDSTRLTLHLRRSVHPAHLRGAFSLLLEKRSELYRHFLPSLTPSAGGRWRVVSSLSLSSKLKP